MVRAIVGANWGDEGKGKITDMLAKESDIIIRFQGGSNAGHTIINNYGRFALHLLPSGVFYDHTTSIIGNGVALNIPFLFNEIEDIKKKGVPQPKILVSDRAQILMPYHVLFDEYEEERLAESPSVPQSPESLRSTLTSMPRLVSRSASCLTRSIFTIRLSACARRRTCC